MCAIVNLVCGRGVSCAYARRLKPLTVRGARIAKGQADVLVIYFRVFCLLRVCDICFRVGKIAHLRCDLSTFASVCWWHPAYSHPCKRILFFVLLSAFDDELLLLLVLFCFCWYLCCVL